MSEELKPCPFCGAKGNYVPGFFFQGERCGEVVLCHSCGAEMPRQWARISTSSVERWNTRTPPPSLHREPTEADREAAWQHRPSCYKVDDYTDWMAGKYDMAAPIIGAMMAHRLAFTTPAASDAEGRVQILSEVRTALRKFEGVCVHTEIMSQDYRTGFSAGFNGADIAILDMINAATPSTQGRKGKDQADG